VECGDYLSEAYECDHDGYPLCESCYDNYYTECAECGEIFRTGDMEEIEGDYYCESCAEKKKNEEESA
jgi:formylmethanofuran dehydrogenase subunit E